MIVLLMPTTLFADIFFKYNVERYDTINSISNQFKVIPEVLIQNNKLENILYLIVDQVLDIPVSFKYTPPQLKDLTFIMNNSVTNWSNPTFEIYKWDKSPNVLIFDTINYSFQSLMFKRLAFYVEKKDFIGSIYSLKELEEEKGWNGHDYNSNDLARFFNQLNFEGHDITRGEEILLDILIKNEIIKFTEYGYIGNGGAIISCSRSSLYNHRKTILNHEAFHGLFFTSPEFQMITTSVWEELDTLSKDIWILYLEFLGYNTADNELIINEFMAYLLQVSEDEVYQYLKEIVYYRLYYGFPENRELINSFFKSNKYPYQNSIKKLRSYIKTLEIE